LNLFQKFLHEVDLFKSKPLNMRVLVLTNLIYIAVLPISNIFTSAYVMLNSGHDMKYVAISQLSLFRNPCWRSPTSAPRCCPST